MAVVFSDVQNMLDAILANSKWAHGKTPPLHPGPHGVFWRKNGNYDQDYQLFTTGNVPNVGIPIMNSKKGQELTSNFFVIITNTNGLEDLGFPQMPADEGPYITDPGYQVSVNGTMMTGQQIQAALTEWLTNGFPK